MNQAHAASGLEDVNVRLQLHYAIDAGAEATALARINLRARGAPALQMFGLGNGEPDLMNVGGDVDAMGVTPVSIPHGVHCATREGPQENKLYVAPKPCCTGKVRHERCYNGARGNEGDRCKGPMGRWPIGDGQTREETAMPWVQVVVILALLEFLFFCMAVGRARGQYKVPAPATTGNEIFERYFRVQMNTLEQLVIFIPAILIFGQYLSPYVATALGVIFLIGRALYFSSYIRDPHKRSLGFGLSVMPNIILLIGAIYGSIRAAMLM
jgi:uncharacterized MAPEG superfamily protein